MMKTNVGWCVRIKQLESFLRDRKVKSIEKEGRNLLKLFIQRVEYKKRVQLEAFLFLAFDLCFVAGTEQHKAVCIKEVHK